MRSVGTNQRAVKCRAASDSWSASVLSETAAPRADMLIRAVGTLLASTERQLNRLPPSLSLTSFSIVLKVSTSWQAGCQNTKHRQDGRSVVSNGRTLLHRRKLSLLPPRGHVLKTGPRSSSVSASPLVIKLNTCRSTHRVTK